MAEESAARFERRGFLASLGVMTGVAALRPRAVGADISVAPGTPSSGEWDLSWLNRLRGKHRQVFDLSNMEIGLLVVRNWFDAHEKVFGLRFPGVNAVIGIGGRAFPINASDELYRKFPIGELWKVTDPGTGQPAARNIFQDGGRTPVERESTVRALQARGAIFWQCNNALHTVAERIGGVVKRPADEVYAELRSALNPGVKLIPAHTMLLGLAQERGCAYESL
jgi:hypothetical protein